MASYKPVKPEPCESASDELALCRPRAADISAGQLQGSRSDSEKKRACSPLAANHRKQQSLVSHCQRLHGVVLENSFDYEPRLIGGCLVGPRASLVARVAVIDRKQSYFLVLAAPRGENQR